MRHGRTEQRYFSSVVPMYIVYTRASWSTYVRPEDMRDDVSGVLVRSDKLVCHEPLEGERRKVGESESASEYAIVVFLCVLAVATFSHHHPPCP